MDLAALAWCTELKVCKGRRATDLMTASTAEGLSLASIHDEPWKDAFRESFDSVMERMRTQPPASGSRSHAYVELHLEGSSVEPWSLPGRSCVFGTLVNDPDWRELCRKVPNHPRAKQGADPERFYKLIHLFSIHKGQSSLPAAPKGLARPEGRLRRLQPEKRTQMLADGPVGSSPISWGRVGALDETTGGPDAPSELRPGHFAGTVISCPSRLQTS